MAKVANVGPAPIPKIVAYCRVSTREQGIDGLGMEAQDRTISDYARSHGSEIIARYHEVETGRRNHMRNRPELRRALSHARLAGATLVIARLDRLARSVLVTSQLMASGIEFIACDNPHANRLTIHILAAMAEYESKAISERTKAALAAAKARGKVWTAGVITPEIQRIGNLAAAAAALARSKEYYADLLPIVISMRRDTDLTLEACAQRLNSQGHFNQRQRPWKGNTIRDLLRREGRTDLARGHLRCGSVKGRYNTLTVKARAAYAGIVPLVRRLYDSGKSCDKVAAELNRRGWKTQRWTAWTGPTLLILLEREGIERRHATNEDLLPRILKAARNSVKARRKLRQETYLKALPIARSLRTRGFVNLEIAERLNAKGLRSIRGGPWNAAKVSRMLLPHKSRQATSRKF